MAKLSEQTREKIIALRDHYPDRRSAVMPALQHAQAELGLIEEDTMNEVSVLLEVPANQTAEVVSFYTMFDRTKKGKHKIEVCRNLSCALRGNLEMIEHLEKKLNIKTGETTPDGKFTLLAVECLGACGWAPMMMVGDTYYELLNREKVDAVVNALVEDQTPAEGPYTQEVFE